MGGGPVGVSPVKEEKGRLKEIRPVNHWVTQAHATKVGNRLQCKSGADRKTQKQGISDVEGVRGIATTIYLEKGGINRSLRTWKVQ